MAANYDTAAGIEGVFKGAAADGQVSQATADAITALIADLQTSGGTIAVTARDSNITSANVSEVTNPILMMGDNTSVDATFGANSDVQALILGKTDVASNIVFDTAKDITVQLGGADGDKVTTGSGADNVTFAGGSATVDTGAGNDTVVIQGNGDLNVRQGGKGDMDIRLESDQVQATIDAGDGFDKLILEDARSAHSFEVVDGKFIMHSDKAITMEGVNVVTFEDSAGEIKDITILASNEGQAMVGRIYQVALGRQAIDSDAAGTNVDGLKFWLDMVDEGSYSADHVYQAMLACPEFAQTYANMGDEEFVTALMKNIGANVTAVNGATAAEYAAQLASGAISRADLAIDFAQSSEAVNALGLGADGIGYVIEGF